ncbi:hypothetical protein AB6A40_003019 [Gnathostoma spinigerum]|uniref:Glycoprotein endo-alpha-1,2-mannosidase n=1 Tax=Gnathostoma spinigerum TaxID=75299 RepID=A0ABD6E8A5_9BILA
MGALFYVKWLSLVGSVCAIFSLLYLMSSQVDQSDDSIAYHHRHVNPKMKFLAKNEVSEKEAGQHGISMTTTSARNLENPSALSIHIFYYPWYGSPKFDGGKYYHWNHPYLPNWDKSDQHNYPKGNHVPPPDIGSNFYPLLGPYSSRDPLVIEQHMKWISSAGVDVLVISWFPPGLADEQGHPWDDLIPSLMNVADKHRLKVTFHLEPYSGRNAVSIHRDIKYIIDTYGNHSAFYRLSREQSQKDANVTKLPMLYVYDSYLIGDNEWRRLLATDGDLSLRNTVYDIIIIGLIVKENDKYSLLKANFDGIYTYFASEGFTYGSSTSNWPAISAFCRKNSLIFVPSAGPGYNDLRIRPWNGGNVKGRDGGNYYAKQFESAHNSRAHILSITSFNEWHEGTQIEPAVAFHDNETDFVYIEYEKGPMQYLHATLDLIKKYFTPLHIIGPEQIQAVV